MFEYVKKGFMDLADLVLLITFKDVFVSVFVWWWYVKLKCHCLKGMPFLYVLYVISCLNDCR